MDDVKHDVLGVLVCFVVIFRAADLGILKGIKHANCRMMCSESARYLKVREASWLSTNIPFLTLPLYALSLPPPPPHLPLYVRVCEDGLNLIRSVFVAL